MLKSKIHHFVMGLSPTQRINLYVSLVLCEYPVFTQRYVAEKAKTLSCDALESLLYKSISSGLEMKKIDH